MNRYICVLTLLILALTGCTSEQMYATGRNAQRAQCLKQVDPAARDACMKDAATTHDTYKTEVDSAGR